MRDRTDGPITVVSNRPASLDAPRRREPTLGGESGGTVGCLGGSDQALEVLQPVIGQVSHIRSDALKFAIGGRADDSGGLSSALRLDGPDHRAIATGEQVAPEGRSDLPHPGDFSRRVPLT
jgi:hypothetical protein